MAIRVTFWHEFRHEKTVEKVKKIYPDGLHAYLKSCLECDDIKITLAALDDPNQGITDEILQNTDVLMWWGHMAHDEVGDELVEKIRQRVYAGMGFLPLHSAHHSKPFKRIVGCTGNLTWGRNQKAIVWNLAPWHPISKGVPLNFQITEELYSEPFYIPKPDEIIFTTWFEDGNIFRGGVTYRRGLGKIFYFHTGHEEVESLKDVNVQRIIKNGIYWCAPEDIGLYNGDNLHQTEPVLK